MAADLVVLKRPRKSFTVAMATGPSHVPRTFALTGAETGNVLVPSFFPVARMGPPLRVCTVGDTVRYYGGDSYIRGSGAASGHTWKVYNFNTSLTDGAYLTDRGSPVTTFVGVTFDFTPASPGTYSVELELTGQLVGDGVTSPYGKGVRFLKVFAAGGYDLEGIPELNGPNGSLDDGGVTLDLSYRMPDNLNGRQIVNHLMRVCVNMDLWHATASGVFERYNWQPGDLYNEVLFSGLIDGSTIREDARTHEIAYRLAGAQLPLTLLQVPTLYVSGVHDGEPYNTYVPPSFYDEALWLLVRGVVDTTDPGWTHVITNLKASDPLLHIIERHTNLATFFDLVLDQSATDVVSTTEASAGSVGDWARAMQSGRFGRVTTNRWSQVFCGPDDDFKPNAFRPSPYINIDGDLYRSIRVNHPQPAVGQVYVETADTLKADAANWKVAPDDPINGEIRQAVRAYTLTSQYPATPEPGRRMTYQAARFNDQTALNALAQRLYARDNARFPEIELEMGMFPHLDLGQPVTIELDPWTEEGWAEWNSGGSGVLRCYVTGYSNTLDPAGRRWKTTLRLREATAP
jgi:hypothetical protein